MAIYDHRLKRCALKAARRKNIIKHLSKTTLFLWLIWDIWKLHLQAMCKSELSLLIYTRYNICDGISPKIHLLLTKNYFLIRIRNPWTENDFKWIIWNHDFINNLKSRFYNPQYFELFLKSKSKRGCCLCSPMQDNDFCSVW